MQFQTQQRTGSQSPLSGENRKTLRQLLGGDLEGALVPGGQPGLAPIGLVGMDNAFARGLVKLTSGFAQSASRDVLVFARETFESLADIGPHLAARHFVAQSLFPVLAKRLTS